MYGHGYYDGSQAQDAMAVVAKWMGKNSDLRVVYHDGNAVDADIFNGVIRIPKLACSNGLTDESLNLLRGRVYHEAGHISQTRLSKAEYPKGVLFEILNAIEDRRMERAMAEKYPGAGAVFGINRDYYNQKIAEQAASAQGIQAPIWEALVAMSFQSEGSMPQWRLGEKAQKYFDAAYDVFVEWKGLKDAQGSVKLAEKIYDILKDTHEQEKEEQKEEEEEQEEEEEDSDDGSGDGEEGESEESEETGKGESEETESSESASGESEESDGEGSGGPRDFDEIEDEEDGESPESEELDDSEGSASGSNDDTRSSEVDSDSGDYEPEDGNPKGGEEDDSEAETPNERNERLEKELEGESKGKGLEEFQDEDISEALSELDPEDAEYLSRRDLDEHNMIEGSEKDKETFKTDREQVASSVAAMTSALVQALRAQTRCRKMPNLRRGKIDRRKLVHIAKSLSKEVFFKTRQGEKLETAVSIIIDESGSMGKYHKVRLVAIAVGEALAQLNIPFEITGTTTKYFGSSSSIQPLNGMDRSNPMVYNHYKTFEQGWMSVRHNMSKTGAHFNNVDGEAVEYATRRLLGRSEARKIVLSLSDGRPDAGHSNSHKMGKNIVRTCKRAREAGVEVYGFGIETSAPRDFYGADNFVYLKDVDVDFAKSFVSILSGGHLYVGV